MASMMLDLPAPVGPTRANRSAPVKSTTVGPRKAVKPSTSSRTRPHARPRPRSSIAARRPARRTGATTRSSCGVALAEVLGEQVVRACGAGGRGRPCAGGAVAVVPRRQHHLDGVGQPRPAPRRPGPPGRARRARPAGGRRPSPARRRRRPRRPACPAACAGAGRRSAAPAATSAGSARAGPRRG